jgi:hypothetical protein
VGPCSYDEDFLGGLLVGACFCRGCDGGIVSVECGGGDGVHDSCRDDVESELDSESSSPNLINVVLAP